MKVNVEIEGRPEEARRFMGPPDVEKANKVYIDAQAKAMGGVSNADQLQEYAKNRAPMGQFGLKMFQNFIESGNAFFGRHQGQWRGSKKKSRRRLTFVLISGGECASRHFHGHRYG